MSELQPLNNVEPAVLHLHNVYLWKNIQVISSEIVQILMVILCVHLFFAVIKFWFEVLNLISVNMCV